MNRIFEQGGIVLVSFDNGGNVPEDRTASSAHVGKRPAKEIFTSGKYFRGHRRVLLNYYKMTK